MRHIGVVRRRACASLGRRIVSRSHALARNRYRFQCREWSAATGITNFRARWYDSVTGRWLSKDPIGLSGGLNLYAFCGDDPVNSLDPFGHDPDDDIIDKFHAILDVIGVFDPTPISDGLNSIIYLVEGDFVNASISAASIVPYIGDGAKAGKYGAKAARSLTSKENSSIIQTGDHTLNTSTLKTLGLSKGEGKKAIEGLKRENGLPNNWHGKIGGDGSVFDQQGNYIYNLNAYR